MRDDFMLRSEHKAVLKAAQERCDFRVEQTRATYFWFGVWYSVAWALIGAVFAGLAYIALGGSI